MNPQTADSMAARQVSYSYLRTSKLWVLLSSLYLVPKYKAVIFGKWVKCLRHPDTYLNNKWNGFYVFTNVPLSKLRWEFCWLSFSIFPVPLTCLTSSAFSFAVTIFSSMLSTFFEFVTAFCLRSSTLLSSSNRRKVALFSVSSDAAFSDAI